MATGAPGCLSLSKPGRRAGLFAVGQPAVTGVISATEHVKIVFSNPGNRSSISATRTTLRCSTPLLLV
jgi:hypothetical protein